MANPLPKISESDLSAKNLDLIKNVAAEAATYLKVDLHKDPAVAIVEKVDLYVHGLQRKKVPTPEDEDVNLFFGCLWGEQLVREFGWEWTSVTFHEHDDSKAIGVVSQDRSLVVYPFHFIEGCLENEAPVTIMLAFNMLRDGSKIPKLPAKGFMNLMDGVHHIVPRD